MGRKKRIEDCRTSGDFVRWARRHGARVENGKRHYKVRYRGGHVAVPRHGELRHGTRKAVIKAMVALGLALLVFLCNMPTWLADWLFEVLR